MDVHPNIICIVKPTRWTNVYETYFILEWHLQYTKFILFFNGTYNISNLFYFWMTQYIEFI